ncbi:hypothetical protein NMY22_g18941 [Coprinellus aureogranulatus]|nr:hypothetical protein NMY22_g18941 [Coprinellus aureogranulatus]
MPGHTGRRSQKVYSSVNLEEEIDSFEKQAQTHRQAIRTHQRKLAHENRALEVTDKKLEELRRKREAEEEKQEEELRRRQAKENSNAKARAKKEKQGGKKKSYLTVLEQRDADLPWEKMTGDGVCERCYDKQLECYRVIEAADTRRAEPRAASHSKKFLIGKKVYSRCQKCRMGEAKCNLMPSGKNDRDVVLTPRLKGTENPPASTRKRKRQDSPQPGGRKQTLNTKVKVEEVFTQPLQLPTPSNEPSAPVSAFQAIPRSNTHNPIQIQASPGPSKRQPSVSRRVHQLEKAIQDIRDEQRRTSERLEQAIGRLVIHSGMQAGSPKSVGEERDLSYVSESD